MYEPNVKMAEWHIITSEYPPRTGGVGDYTRLVAEGLAGAGDAVCVWCPSHEEPRGETHADETRATVGRLVVRRELEGFGAGDLRRLGRALDSHAAPRRLLVQYVPHGFGPRAVNIGFCLWLLKRARMSGDRVETIVHEPFLEFAGTWRQRAAAAAQRLMTALLVGASSRVWVTIPAWEALWRPYAFGRRIRFEWLPVPSTIPVVADPSRTAEVRSQCVSPRDGLLVGHFGTYTQHIAEQLGRVLPALLSSHADATALLLGRGSEEARDRVLREHPSLAGRIHATGLLAAGELSAHLAACDILLQPFTDGVSSRRTSAMAGLAHGLAVATTSGRLTETLWAESGAVALAPAGDDAALIEVAARLLASDAERARLGAAARTLYRERFDVSRTIAALHGRERQSARLAA